MHVGENKAAVAHGEVASEVAVVHVGEREAAVARGEGVRQW